MSIVTVTLACLLVSSVWNILFWGRSCGISMPIFTGIVIFLLLWNRKAGLSKNKLTLLIHITLLVYLSVCVLLYRNIIILRTTIPAVFVGLGAIAFAGRKGYLFSNFLGVIESLSKTIMLSLFAAWGAITEAFNKMTKTGKASQTTGKVLKGFILSVPFLIIFLYLFSSADPIYNKYLQKFFEFVWQPEVITRVTVIFFTWFLLCGYMALSSKSVSLESYLDRSKPKETEEGLIVFVFLLMINLLFLSFIIIQLGYLFGGENVIRQTKHTYASYVHKGFYEFWAAVILISIIIIASDFRLRGQKGSIRRAVEWAWIAMIIQTLVIIGSGLKRIYAYEEAYGYTYLRILVALFFLWMAGVFILFILKIIRKKSLSWLISSGICLAFIFLVFVSTFSIDKYIARRNVDRYLNKGKKIDVEYLSKLSTDAYFEIEHLKNETKDEHIQNSAEKILLQMRKDAANNLEHWVSWNLSLSNTEQ